MKWRISDSTSSGETVVELGLKLLQNNQDRPNLCENYQNHDDDGDDNDAEGGGPTCNVYNTNNNRSLIRDNATTATKTSTTTSSTSNVCATHVSCIGDCFATTTTTAPALVRGLQPFHASSPSYYYSHPNSFFKSSGGMAKATMGFPFTAAQWMELERQAMIYKYMVASLPVPPDLLYSSFPSHLSTGSTFSPASYFVGRYGGGISVRWSGNSKDAEPGRCRRTDGKKWRCSRDVAPNQKYCERHMHRGRPRSRKHVEQQQLLLNQNHSSLANLTINSNNDNTNNNDSNKVKDSLAKKTRLSDPLNPRSDGSCIIQPSKASIYDQSMVSNAVPFEDSRTMAWSDDQQWHHMMQSNVNTSEYQQQFGGEPMNVNSNAGLNSKTGMGLFERPLIDAWSVGDTEVNDHNKPLTSSTFGQGNAINEEMCQIHMGLGLIDSWVASTNSTPGGPLAEVLRPGAASSQSMSDAGESDFVTPLATAVSSPSGVLQKTFATFSDSSESKSPICHHSRTSSDMPFHWLN